MTTPPEVAYFQYMRNYMKRHGADDIPEGTYRLGLQLRPDTYSPNYGFFVPELVCWEHPRPKIKWGGPEYNRFSTMNSEDLISYECVDCGLLDPGSLKRCPNCKGAFYDLFRHQNQTDAYHHCWACLEAGSNNGNPHRYYSKFTNLAPPTRLIPPPVSAEDVKKGEDAFWNNIQRLLAE